MEHYDVVIVGGGVSGLVAASTLIQNGITNIAVLEAQERVGGRIDSVCTDGRFVELGAQWIHGQKDNSLYKYASERDLVHKSSQSYEAEGIFYYGEGKTVRSDVIEDVRQKVYEYYEECNQFSRLDVDPETVPESVGHFFLQKFKNYIESQEDLSKEEKTMKYRVFEYFMKFERIDNACESMFDLSCVAWGEYYDCEGDRYVNLKAGYISVINSFLQRIPSQVLKLNCPVQTIQWQPCIAEEDVGKGLVTVVLENGTKYSANHVIYTPSIGYTKENYQQIFKPRLPNKQEMALNKLGFGVIDKIFLEYEVSFWGQDCRGIHIVWPDEKLTLPGLSAKPDDHMWHLWYRGISGFDVVDRQPNTLLGWLGGDDARYMESLTETEIATICTELLRYFSGDKHIPRPKNIYRSRWYSNKYIRGSYSYRSNKCDSINIKAADLAEPIYTTITGKTNRQVPVLLVSGEGTNTKHYSTVHGAFAAGEDASNLIISWLQS